MDGPGRRLIQAEKFSHPQHHGSTGGTSAMEAGPDRDRPSEETDVLFRARTTLSDRPGSLATLARHCGEQGVNILGLQIFPGVEGVTDELVLRLRLDQAAGQLDIADVQEVNRLLTVNAEAQLKPQQ